MMGGQYAALYARKNADGGMEIVYAESEGSDKDKSEKILSVVPLTEAGTNEAGKDHEINFRMIFVRRSLADVTDEGKVVFKTDPSEAEDLFFANAEAEKPELFIFWSADGEHFRDSGCRYTPSDHTWVGAKIGEHFRDSGCRYTPSDHTWVGAKIGLFALAEKQAKEGRADFLSVRTEKI